jgi:AcrR family transcriptional regulator
MEYAPNTWTPRQREILATALEILAEEGSRALTMKRVAQYLHLTEAAIYRHFRNKKALLCALYGFVREQLLAQLAPILATDKPPPERLAFFIEGTIRTLHTHRGVNLILLAESIYQRDEELTEAMLAIFTGYKSLAETLLQAGKASGHFREDLNTDMSATCIAGMIQGVLTRHMLTGGKEIAVDPSVAAGELADGLLRGFLPANREHEAAKGSS